MHSPAPSPSMAVFVSRLLFPMPHLALLVGLGTICPFTNPVTVMLPSVEQGGSGAIPEVAQAVSSKVKVKVAGGVRSLLTREQPYNSVFHG